MIFLGVGTNIGHKENNINLAYEHLEAAGVQILRKSSLYHSAAWGIRDQDSFLNTVIEVGFDGSPEELLAVCLKVENTMGRKRSIKWGPRLIDLDIIDFDRMKWETETLRLPHPFYTQRSFVLAPLAELEPKWTVEASGKPIQFYLEQIHDRDVSIRLGNS